MRKVFIVLVPLKGTCIPLLLHILLNLSPSPCMYGTTIEIFLLCCWFHYCCCFWVDLWLRLGEDTFIIHKAEQSQQLLCHSNTQDPHIQLTMEEPDQDVSVPFLDMQVSPGPNNTLTNKVYRKLTHTGQYVHWDNNHFIMAKHIVFSTLAYGAKVVSTNQQTLHKELEYIRKALQACHFPPWTLNK